ncbi:hypothetical protein Bca4012_076932 [Brassica carinata]
MGDIDLPRSFADKKTKSANTQIDRGEEGLQEASLESKRKAIEAARNFSKIARRLGRSQYLTIPNLKEIRKKCFPEIFFWMETKKRKDMVVDLQVVLGYDRVFTVEPIGLSGDKNLIDVEVNFAGVSFFMSFVYGEPGHRGKEIIWERLMRYGVNRKDFWGWVGDFNEILHNGEKIGGLSRSEGSFESFKECVRVCGMVELSGFGDSFTWSGVLSKKYIQSKLDRCFGNKEWKRKFPFAVQVFMERMSSDHKPVLVHLFGHQSGSQGCFRFDKRMVGKQKVRECILEAWNRQNGNNQRSLVEGFGNVRRSLGRWKRESGINSKERICALRSDLEAEYSYGTPD